MCYNGIRREMSTLIPLSNRERQKRLSANMDYRHRAILWFKLNFLYDITSTEFVSLYICLYYTLYSYL